MKKKIFGILLTLALVCSFGLMAPVPVAAVDDGQTLNVAQWSVPDTLSNVSGRETVLKVDGTYHMWYSPSDTAIYHTSSTSPASFTAATTACTFTGGEPAEVGSVAVVHESGTFYMIAYGIAPDRNGATDPTKKFAIYTSTNGYEWTYGNTVFDGTAAFGTLSGFQKIDGPYLFKDGSIYRLYFQVKTQVSGVNYYDIYIAELTAGTTLADIAAAGGPDFTLANDNNPVLPHEASTDAWDGTCVMHPWVVKDGETYYMWYSAHNGTNPQRLGMAKSGDGINWVKSPGNPIIPDPGDGFGEPSVIKDGNIWRMWAIANPSSFLAYNINYYEATGPFEFSSIQAAVNAASAGDTIKVAPGTYTYYPWVSDIPVKSGTIKILNAGGGSIPEEDSPTGGTITVSGSGVSATLVAAQYTSNPGGAHGLQAQGYFDVYLSSTEGVDSVTIEFAPALPNTVIYYWDGAAWTRCSSQSYNDGVVTVTISSTDTTPGLSDLVGSTTAPALPFMSATSPPIGGEAFPISPWAASAPWIALGVALVAGAGMFAWRRARA